MAIFLIFLIDLAETYWIFLILRGCQTANPGHPPGTWPAGPSNSVNPWPGPPLGIKKIQHLSAKSIKKIKNIGPGGGPARMSIYSIFLIDLAERCWIFLIPRGGSRPWIDWVGGCGWPRAWGMAWIGCCRPQARLVTLHLMHSTPKHICYLMQSSFMLKGLTYTHMITEHTFTFPTEQTSY